jgi:hypothetical protein
VRYDEDFSRSGKILALKLQYPNQRSQRFDASNRREVAYRCEGEFWLARLEKQTETGFDERLSSLSMDVESGQPLTRLNSATWLIAILLQILPEKLVA